MLRRILALVLTCTMVLPALVKSELVCAQYSSAQSAAAMPGMDHGQSSTHDHTKAPCDAPTNKPCCQSMMSCVQSMALSSPMRSAESPVAAMKIVHALVTIPLSRFVAPEPPPPKA
jgi:hypothetical protein